ncbi:MAG TPA: hypothetical protein VGO40_15530 [Longimicrobium sp.]|jgi:hypothetical protein|nr:hypothetical protein [Longimicrobium sp.]
MKLSDNFGPAQEYEALRTELQESRSYVFERPLLILGAVAGITAFGADQMKDGEYLALLPPLITALMIYNLWSTAWRQSNSSRIVAYIQTAFEERSGDSRRWWGWETCLKEYRKHKEVDTCVRAKVKAEDGAKPDPLMYWKALWFLHIGIVIAALLVSCALQFSRGYVWPDLVGLGVNLVLAMGFFYVCCQNRPKKMGLQIERDLKVWKEILDHLDEEVRAAGAVGTRPVSPEPGP